MANACPNLVLKVEVKNSFLGLRKQALISASCTKTQAPVQEPEIGCGQCHSLPPIFTDDS